MGIIFTGFADDHIYCMCETVCVSIHVHLLVWPPLLSFVVHLNMRIHYLDVNINMSIEITH